MDDLFDIAIVGSGFATNALIEELGNYSIAVIQGEESTRASEKKDTVSKNHFPLSDCSVADFGGSSATWGGRCVDYNDIDFAPREYLSAKWPLNKSQLKPFYKAAADFLKIGDPEFDCNNSSIDPLLDNKNLFSSECIERWSEPLRLKKRKNQILSKSHLTYFSDIHVNHFERDAGKYWVFDSSGCLILKCNILIIAAGGLGTTKIMLNSVPSEKYKSLGKYYQGHLSGKLANVVLTDPKSNLNSFIMDQDVYTRRRFQPTYKTVVDNTLLNTALWLDNLKIGDATHKNSILSFVYLLFSMPVVSKLLAPPSIRKAILIGENSKVAAHFKNIIFSPIEVFKFSIPFFIKRFMRTRKIPGFFLHSRSGKYALHFHAEQEPLKSNCITPKKNGGFNISYSYSKLDCDSIFKVHKLLDIHLRENNLGYLEYMSTSIEQLRNKILAESIDGIHQIGTTRMSQSIDDGVVDKDLEVFDFDNLFILSTSVFPTSSQANPTFLLVVFAKRLAQYLNKRLTSND